MILRTSLIAILLLVSSCHHSKKDRKPDTPGEPSKGITGRVLGHDLLGAMHPRFDTDSAQKAIAKGSALGFLDYTFGTALSGPEHLIANVHPSYVRVHILNTVCVRNRNCGNYEPGAGVDVNGFSRKAEAKDAALLGHLKHRTDQWRQLAARYPKTTFIVSPALEHNMTPAAWRVLADAVHEAWPGVQLLNNPMSGLGERYKGALLGAHGQNPHAGADVTSLDGEELMDIDTAAWVERTKNNKITFRWTRGYNLRDQNEKFTDPRNRKNSPTAAMFQMYEHATDPVPPPGPAAFPCTPIDNSVIYKPLSEDKGNGDPRANKPVLIASLGASGIQLVGANSHPVSQLAYYGKFTDSRLRYYSGHTGGSGKHGYEIQQAALANTGSPYVYARGGGKCIGPFLPGRRQGSYR